MKRRLALGISLGTVSLVLAAASSTLRAGIVSPDGKLVAYTIPAYDEDANLANDVFLRAGDGSSAKTLGRGVGARDQVSWIGNDRIVLSEFGSSRSCLVFDTSGKRLPEIVLPSECEPLYLAVSPDGEKVAFTGSRGSGDHQDYGLFVLEPKTGAVKLLIKKALKTLAAWSPDSRKLAIGAGAGYAKN
jgi:Tol biopolymer transport system component